MRRGWVAFGLGAAVAALFLGRWTAELLADRMWAEAVGVAASQADITWLRLALRLGAFAIAAAWYLVNLLLLYRQIGAVQVPRQVGNLEFVEHVPRHYLLIAALVVGLSLALVSSYGAADWWSVRALAGTGTATGATDPVLGRDLAYYLFDLPWERALHTFALWLAGVALVLMAMLFTSIGAIRRDDRRLAFLPFARWHLAALSGTLALALAWGYALEPAEMVAGLHGVPYDAILVDVRIPGALVLAILALVTAAASIVWMRVDRARIPAAAWGALLATTLAVHFIIPSAVAAGRGPDGRSNADLSAAQASATRRALGLRVDTLAVALAVPDLQFARRHEPALVRAPIWDAFVLAELLNRTARAGPGGGRAEGRFFDATLSLLPAGPKPAVAAFLAVREADSVLAGAERRGRPAYGLGVVAIHAARVAPGGLPLYLPDLRTPDSVTTRPVSIRLAAEEMWFTPAGGGHVLVPADGGPVGMHVGGTGRRLALAWALQSPALLSRARAPDGTVVVSERAVGSRLARFAPFARFGAAWPAVLDGRLTWLAWGYVAASAYPLAQAVEWRGEAVRYLHPGFIGVVDAATGVTRLYRSDGDDPLSRAWERAFPDLARTWDSFPAELRPWLRYPDESFAAALQVLRARPGRARPAEPQWWAGPSVGDSTSRLRLRAVDEVQLDPRVAALIEGILDEGSPRLRVLRYPEPYTLPGPSELEREFAEAAPDGAVVSGRLRLLPFEDGAIAAQAFYADSGTLAGLVAGWRGALGSGSSLAEALRRVAPREAGPGPVGPARSYEAAREWFLRLDRARARGDWEAFGAAWAGLRAALGVEAETGAARVDTPIPRD